MRNDRQRRKGVHVGAVAEVVVVVKVRVEHEADGPVGPLANLRDVFAGCGGQETGIDDEHLAFADDHRGVAAGKAVAWVLVLDLINAVGQFRDLARSVRECRHSEKCDGERRQARQSSMTLRSHISRASVRKPISPARVRCKPTSTLRDVW